MARLKYWVWLSCAAGVEPLAKNHLVAAMGGPEAVFFAGKDELMFAGATAHDAQKLMDKSLAEASRVLEACEEQGVRILTLQDADYPERLRSIPDAPVVLFVKGRLPAVDESAVIAVVGTRKASSYGQSMAARLGEGIARGGGIVVSGLADGCDGIAMEAALRAGGTVIGVLGTAIDVVYPAKNRRLFEETAVRGALVSEHGPGTRTYQSDFRLRNRIISGLALGVAVTEAPERSGTRITVDRALEQGRDVFAVPAAVGTPAGDGYLALLALGAQTAASGADILARYEGRFRPVPARSAPVSTKTVPTHIKKEIDKPRDIVYIDLTDRTPDRSERWKDLPDVQRRILEVMDRPSMHADEIIEAAGLSASEALAALTMLQVAGLVSQGAGRRYSRL